MLNTPTMSIHNTPRSTRKLPAVESVIHLAAPERSYHHHQHLTSRDGVLYATFSSGDRDEDMLGQSMVLCTSHDRGQTWSKPQTILAPEPAEHGLGVVTAEGLYFASDGALYALAAYYERSYMALLMYYATGGGGMVSPDWQCNLNVHTRLLRSDDLGKSFREVARFPSVFPNLGPMITSRGRLISPGNAGTFYTDDPTSLTSWKRSHLPGIPDDFRDDPEGNNLLFRPRPIRCNEMSIFELADGTLRAMFRTDKFALACSDSTDHGLTWTEPQLTQYTDAGSRHHFGTLPDGRYFGLSNPTPRSARTPLVLALSQDGSNFDHHFIVGDAPNVLPRVHGVHKYGRYGYPFFHIMDDECFVIYSRNKEDVLLSRFHLSDLQA
jgi:hypothetical protein